MQALETHCCDSGMKSISWSGGGCCCSLFPSLSERPTCIGAGDTAVVFPSLSRALAWQYGFSHYRVAA